MTYRNSLTNINNYFSAYYSVLCCLLLSISVSTSVLVIILVMCCQHFNKYLPQKCFFVLCTKCCILWDRKRGIICGIGHLIQVSREKECEFGRVICQHLKDYSPKIVIFDDIKPSEYRLLLLYNYFHRTVKLFLQHIIKPSKQSFAFKHILMCPFCFNQKKRDLTALF